MVILRRRIECISTRVRQRDISGTLRETEAIAWNLSELRTVTNRLPNGFEIEETSKSLNLTTCAHNIPKKLLHSTKKNYIIC